MFDRLFAMTYGAVGDWCSRFKKDWKAGRRLIPIIEVLILVVFVFFLCKEAISFFQKEAVVIPQGYQSNFAIGNTGQVSQTLTISGKMEPKIWYKIASSSIQQTDGLYLTTLDVVYGYDPSLEINNFSPVLSKKFIKCWQSGIGEITSNIYGLNDFKGRSGIEAYLFCISQEPIKDDGSLVGL